MSRRALLIAIADYKYLRRLDYVNQDIPFLTPVLLRAGFALSDITKIGAGVDGPADISSTELKIAIESFLADSGREDDLLILFSGHGVEIEGRRVLIPQGYHPDFPESLDNLVWDGEIAARCRGSKARSVVVAIDACRTEAAIKLGPATKGEPSNEPADRPLTGDFAGEGTDAPTLVFCYSCAPGERSGPDRENTCSAFTRAFAEIIGAETGPARLDAFVKMLAERVNRVASRVQTVTSNGREGRSGSWTALVIKEDSAERFRQRVRGSRWCARLIESQLYARAKEIPGFALQLQSIALEAEVRVGEAAHLLPGQRWRDDCAWVRLLGHLWNVLLGPVGGSAKIFPAEAAVLLAVPLLYETVLAAAESQLAQSGQALDPIEAGHGNESPLWRLWCNAFAADEVDAHRARLIERGLADAAEDVAAWRLNVFCHTAGELWDLSGGAGERSGWARDAVQGVLAEAPMPEVQKDRRVYEVLSAERLLRLARLMFASLEDVVMDSTGRDKAGLDPEAAIGAYPEQLVVNEVRLVHLLNLAARMTLDARRLSPLLAEHLGSDDRLQVAWLKDRLAEAVWQEAGERRFTIQLECAHEPLDAALLAAVEELEFYRMRLAQRTDVNGSCMTEILPVAFSAERLNRGSTALARPPLRFELDRSRVISLLMGQELYGDSAPALRELYQNALDACRYRRAQEELYGGSSSASA